MAVVNPFEEVFSSPDFNQSYDDFYNNYGWSYDEPDPVGITDSRMKADLEQAKANAKATGNKNAEYWINLVIDKGVGVLGSLTKAGILKNQNLAALTGAGYSNFGTDANGKVTVNGQATDDTPNNNLPTTKTFNIDWSNPTTIILIAGAVFGLIYLLFFNSKTRKNGKR